MLTKHRLPCYGWTIPIRLLHLSEKDTPKKARVKLSKAHNQNSLKNTQKIVSKETSLLHYSATSRTTALKFSLCLLFFFFFSEYAKKNKQATVKRHKKDKTWAPTFFKCHVITHEQTHRLAHYKRLLPLLCLSLPLSLSSRDPKNPKLKKKKPLILKTSHSIYRLRERKKP